MRNGNYGNNSAQDLYLVTAHVGLSTFTLDLVHVSVFVGMGFFMFTVYARDKTLVLAAGISSEF